MNDKYTNSSDWVSNLYNPLIIHTFLILIELCLAQLETDIFGHSLVYVRLPYYEQSYIQ